MSKTQSLPISSTLTGLKTTTSNYNGYVFANWRAKNITRSVSEGEG